MAVTKQKISLTNEDGELNQEYLARLAIFDQIMGKYSPQTCLSDKELAASLQRLFKINKRDLSELVCNLTFYRESFKGAES